MSHISTTEAEALRYVKNGIVEGVSKALMPSSPLSDLAPLLDIQSIELTITLDINLIKRMVLQGKYAGLQESNSVQIKGRLRR